MAFSAAVDQAEREVEFSVEEAVEVRVNLRSMKHLRLALKIILLFIRSVIKCHMILLYPSFPLKK